MEIKEFLKTLTTDPKAIELLKASKEPADDKEAINQYAEIAKKLGLDVSLKDLEAFLNAKEKLQQKLTEKADSAVKEALDEKSLENVAGGINGECADTYTYGEWCWFTDACSVMINFYTTGGPIDPNDPNWVNEWDVIEGPTTPGGDDGFEEECLDESK